MSRAEKLRSARQGYAVAWAAFQRAFASNALALHCFFEGDDLKYYGMRIETRIRECEIRPFSCGGKDSVLRVRDLIHGDSRFKQAWVAFFVDADFDDNSALAAVSDVYVTPCYSVENFYLTRTAFSRLVEAEILQPPTEADDTDRNRLMSLYDAVSTSFLDTLQLADAWLYFHRRVRRPPTRIVLSDFSASELVNVTISGASPKYTLGTLDAHFEVSPPSEPAAVQAVETELSASNRILVFRGKFLLTIYAKFLKQLIEDACSRSPKVVTKRRNARLTIQDGNALSQLSQYADVPECLISFLDSIADRRPASA